MNNIKIIFIDEFLHQVKGYTIDAHQIETEDGYILTAWRIYKKSKKNK